MKKVFLRIFLAIGIILSIVILTILISPKPAAYFVRYLFEGGVAKTRSSYSIALNNVYQHTDIDYESAYDDGMLDVFVPMAATQNTPLVIWIHGGAFVGGDKRDVLEYAVEIAAQGYIVASINYELAPEATYPTPLYQIQEAYDYLMRHSEHYKIDPQQVFFAGDSAGAQLATQFIMIQNDAEYAALTGIEQLVNPSYIRGALLYCGPYDIDEFFGGSGAMGFFVGKIAQAYIGSRNWKDDPVTETLSVINYVSRSFPAAFITDGNTDSFTEQGIAFSEKLKAEGVYVKDIFYSSEHGVLPHEYQFDMTLSASVETFNATIEFLNTHKKSNP